MIPLLPPAMEPLFTARFVPYAPLNNPLEVYAIADARRDGTAVGEVFYRLTNSAATQPLYVLKGRAIWPKQWIPKDTTYVQPCSLLTGGRMVVSNARSHPTSRPPILHIATIDRDRLVVSAKVYASPLVTQPRLAFYPVLEAPTLEIPRHFYPARYAQIHKYPISRAQASWLPLKGGDAIGMATFTPPVPDADDPTLARFDEDYLGLLFHKGKVRPLREFVKGGYDLRQLAWASPEGWYIFSADRGKERGLVWLTPIRREKR